MRAKWGLIPCFAFLLSLAAYAEKPSDAELAKRALESEMRTTDQEAIKRHIGRGTEDMKTATQRNPNRLAAASVVFTRGLTVDEVQALAESARSEVARAEAKIPVDEDGRVETISVSATTLLSLDGALKDRLRSALSKHQVTLYKEAYQLKDRQDAASRKAVHELTAASRQAQRIYKIELIGPAKRLEHLSKNADVVAVLPRPQDEVDAYLWQKEHSAQFPKPEKVPGTEKRYTFKEGLEREKAQHGHRAN